MTERPILFSAPMIRALREGRKTVTRRPFKTAGRQTGMHHDPERARLLSMDRSSGYATFGDAIPDDPVPLLVGCPYGAEGDRLWVREAWKAPASLDSDSPRTIGERAVEVGYKLPWCPLRYEADGGTMHAGAATTKTFGGWGRLRASMHMPRWASRITLEITSVRPERLQEITDRDAYHEGVPHAHGLHTCDPGDSGCVVAAQDAVFEFASLWDGLNAARGLSWESNPWVWRVEFRLLDA